MQWGWLMRNQIYAVVIQAPFLNLDKTILLSIGYTTNKALARKAQSQIIKMGISCTLEKVKLTDWVVTYAKGSGYPVAFGKHHKAKSEAISIKQNLDILLQSSTNIEQIKDNQRFINGDFILTNVTDGGFYA